MELGETFVDSIKREVLEETGLSIEVKELIGAYSGYSDVYPNGDEAQPILLFFLCRAVSGELSCDDNETLELKYFRKDQAPVLVNEQHRHMFHDLFCRTAVVIS